MEGIYWGFTDVDVNVFIYRKTYSGPTIFLPMFLIIRTCKTKPKWGLRDY